ncbi:MAG: hypothetical protein ISQ87_02160 [Rhodobacteraceae bacterium]|nr:hypothetical protein [Paracoccaceae bacterium]MBL6638989.1 hypothetical protein [Paracoccaceae bacterium]MBL6788205.1 hypothetical protein [Paracoccaceae bacterium]MBL6858756.1 hypothetical protein [Paracoccaceae bacterium]
MKFVSQRLTDFQRFETLAEAKGILQNRRGDLQKPVTCNWALEFWFRGKMRYPELSVPRFDTPQDWSFELQEAALFIRCDMALEAGDETHSFLRISCTLRLLNLGMFMRLQAIQLAAHKTQKRFQAGCEHYINLALALP